MKKPSPWMAMSIGLELTSTVPWVKSGVMSATIVPRPVWRGLVPPLRVGRLRAEALRLQELRGEGRLGGLEPDRVRVGQVVAHDVDRRFGRRQARQRRAQCGCKTHGSFPLLLV